VSHSISKTEGVTRVFLLTIVIKYLGAPPFADTLQHHTPLTMAHVGRAIASICHAVGLGLYFHLQQKRGRISALSLAR
jgi:putative effector of murein hydrolase